MFSQKFQAMDVMLSIYSECQKTEQNSQNQTLYFVTKNVCEIQTKILCYTYDCKITIQLRFINICHFKIFYHKIFFEIKENLRYFLSFTVCNLS